MLKKHRPKNKILISTLFYLYGTAFFMFILFIIRKYRYTMNPNINLSIILMIGFGLWLISLYLSKQLANSNMRQGLINALLFAGSLLLIFSGFIIVWNIAAKFSDFGYTLTVIALMLAILGVMHLCFDMIIKRNIILLIGVFLSVSSLPTFLIGSWQKYTYPYGPSIDMMLFILVIAPGLLPCATRIISKAIPNQRDIDNYFDLFTINLVGILMYIAINLSDHIVLWTIVTILYILVIIYLSMVLRFKSLFYNSLIMMGIMIITIPFKYLYRDNFPLTIIMTIIALFGFALMSIHIDKKYFKKTAKSHH